MPWKTQIALGFFFVFLAGLVIGSSACFGHVPPACYGHGAVVKERVLKKLDMQEALYLDEIQARAEQRYDPLETLEAYRRYVEYDRKRMWPAWERLLNCMKEHNYDPGIW